ncbi:MAG: hypothetical protein HRK26_04230 [Rickettsiaceae bacterium H1]|nr:hypothetical protein [Rickettsiaceae bacterium H1]
MLKYFDSAQKDFQELISNFKEPASDKFFKGYRDSNIAFCNPAYMREATEMINQV